MWNFLCNLKENKMNKNTYEMCVWRIGEGVLNRVLKWNKEQHWIYCYFSICLLFSFAISESVLKCYIVAYAKYCFHLQKKASSRFSKSLIFYFSSFLSEVSFFSSFELSSIVLGGLTTGSFSLFQLFRPSGKVVSSSSEPVPSTNSS